MPKGTRCKLFNCLAHFLPPAQHAPPGPPPPLHPQRPPGSTSTTNTRATLRTSSPPPPPHPPPPHLLRTSPSAHPPPIPPLRTRAARGGVGGRPREQARHDRRHDPPQQRSHTTSKLPKIYDRKKGINVKSRTPVPVQRPRRHSCGSSRDDAPTRPPHSVWIEQFCTD